MPKDPEVPVGTRAEQSKADKQAFEGKPTKFTVYSTTATKLKDSKKTAQKKDDLLNEIEKE